MFLTKKKKKCNLENSRFRHTSIAVISFFSIFLFFHLQKAEIHPWDEGLYAIRALSIIEGGNIIDQTQNALGGLYSSTYPPLSVWMMALFMKIFGVGELAVRFFSFICSIGSITLIYLISLRLFNEEKSIFSVILVSISIAWNVYSRQGMTEIPIIFFSFLCLWSLIKIGESEKSSKSFLLSLIFGLSFAFSLMTKIVVSFLPLLFAIIYLIYRRKDLKYILLALFIGLMLAFPWHYYMYSNYGESFLKAFFVPHIYSAVENNVPQAGFFYYFNQLIISNPFAIFAFISILVIIKFKILGQRTGIQSYLLTTIIIWFFSLFTIFSLSITKLPHYIVYFLIPSIILSVKVFDVLETKSISPRTIWYIFSFLIISTLWAIGDGLRADMKIFLKDFTISLPIIIFLIVSAGLLFGGLILKTSILEKIKFTYYSRISYIILLMLVLRIVFYTSFAPTEKEAGAKRTVEFIQHLNQEKCIYLFHFYNTSDTINPQLEWYFKVNTTEKDRRPDDLKISLKNDNLDIRSLRKIDNYPNLFVVYYLPQSVELKLMVVQDILQTRNIVFQTRKYIVFGRKKTDRPVGRWI